MKLGNLNKNKLADGALIENELWNILVAIFSDSMRRILWINLTNDNRANLRSMEIGNEVK